MALSVIEPGWLYVIANPAMPRVCKVGFTTREPEERAAELHDTGSPQPYHVVAKWHVDDVRAAERGAHAALGRFRTDAGREWFALPVNRHAIVTPYRRPILTPFVLSWPGAA